MSGFDHELLNDARALLAAFARNNLRSMTIELRAGVQLSLSRDAPALQGTAVTAPHVGTLVQRMSEGQAVRAGETVATLDLLGEAVAIKADIAGLISKGPAMIGDLVEFGEPLAWIEGDDG